jgi:hypothetical protein
MLRGKTAMPAFAAAAPSISSNFVAFLDTQVSSFPLQDPAPADQDTPRSPSPMGQVVASSHPQDIPTSPLELPYVPALNMQQQSTAADSDEEGQYYSQYFQSAQFCFM